MTKTKRLLRFYYFGAVVDGIIFALWLMRGKSWVFIDDIQNEAQTSIRPHHTHATTSLKF